MMQPEAGTFIETHLSILIVKKDNSIPSLAAP